MLYEENATVFIETKKILTSHLRVDMLTELFVPKEIVKHVLNKEYLF